MVRKYDATGQLVSTERTVVEEQKRPNGAVMHATIYRSDVNGQMQEAERRTIESQTQGATSTTDVTDFAPRLERILRRRRKAQHRHESPMGKRVHETEVVQRPGQQRSIRRSRAAKSASRHGRRQGHLHHRPLRTRLHRQNESDPPAGGHHHESRRRLHGHRSGSLRSLRLRHRPRPKTPRRSSRSRK